MDHGLTLRPPCIGWPNEPMHDRCNRGGEGALHRSPPKGGLTDARTKPTGAGLAWTGAE